jgi:hypothetical protein
LQLAATPGLVRRHKRCTAMHGAPAVLASLGVSKGVGASVTSAQERIATAVLVPIVTAILGALGIAFQDWRQRRSQVGRRRLALEDASRQVSFAAEWLNTRKLLADSPEALQEATARAGAWLEEASARVQAATPPPIGERPPVTLRRLLLFYPLQGRAAKIIRGAFYGCVGLVIATTGNAITTAFDPQIRSEYLLGNSTFAIATAAVALGLRFWAVAAEARRPRGEKRQRITLRRSSMRFRRWLLLYRFRRRTASLVRIIFYATLVFAFFWVMAALTEWGTPGFAADLSYLIAVLGYAVGLRYWAASLETTRKESKAGPPTTPATAFEESEASGSWSKPVRTDG